MRDYVFFSFLYQSNNLRITIKYSKNNNTFLNKGRRLSQTSTAAKSVGDTIYSSGKVEPKNIRTIKSDIYNSL